MNMNERRELITKYKKFWDQYIEENPGDKYLETVLRHTCGFDPGHDDKIEKFPVLAIPVIEFEHPADHGWGREIWRDYQANDKLWHFIDVVAQLDDLAVFGTDSGKVPRAYKVFGEKGIIEFLAGFKVDVVFGCIRNDEDVDIAHVGIPLGAIAFRAPIRVGKAFGYLVNAHGGGLRYEDYPEWCIFESE